MVQNLTFEELEIINGGADISTGLGCIITGADVAAAGVGAIYTAATATGGTATFIGVSCSVGLMATGGVVLAVAGVALLGYGFSLLAD
ncbi:MAG: hypothetical protein IJ326_12205 [Lachnospiraceae bacterium]|nr:hypothetical protein [Lachnospiraceae bacterium]